MDGELPLIDGPKQGKYVAFAGKEILTYEGWLQMGSLKIPCQHRYRREGKCYRYQGLWITAKAIRSIN